MKAIVTLFVIALCGVIFYSCCSEEPKQEIPKVTTGEYMGPKDSDSVKYIHQELTLEDSTSHWILNTLKFKVKNHASSPKHIRVCIDPNDKKETILLFPKGISNKQQYPIDESNNWCSDRINLHGNILNGSKDTTFTFAVIVDYKNLEEDPGGAKYAYSNSVCRIRVTY